MFTAVEMRYPCLSVHTEGGESTTVDEERELEYNASVCQYFRLGLIFHLNFSFPSAQTDIAIRLVDGSSPLSGIVELYIKGEWRAVCANLWSTKDAQVACRELGYSPNGMKC